MVPQSRKRHPVNDPNCCNIAVAEPDAVSSWGPAHLEPAAPARGQSGNKGYEAQAGHTLIKGLGCVTLTLDKHVK